MELPYHFRAFDEDGNVIRQSQVAFPTIAAAQSAADKATRIHGDVHVVCISLDPKDSRNSVKDPLKAGFKVLEDTDAESDEEAAAAAIAAKAKPTTKGKAKK